MCVSQTHFSFSPPEATQPSSHSPAELARSLLTFVGVCACAGTENMAQTGLPFQRLPQPHS